MSNGDKKIKVLHILYSLTLAGAENWVKYVFKYVDNDRYKMDVLIHDNTRMSVADDIIKGGGRIFCIPFSKNPLVYARDFNRILRQYGPYDIIHSHLGSAGFQFLLAAQAGVPYRIAHSHIDGARELTISKFVRRQLWKFSHYLIKRFATAGIAVSQVAVQNFGANWSKDPRWRIFYLGIDLDPFRQSIQRDEVLREFDIPEDAFVVGHVGRFLPQKNHDFIIQIIPELLKIEPKTYLMLVGEGPLSSGISKKAKELGIMDRVIFCGLRHDVPRLMKAMDVFVFPSLFEGLPLVLMETQAAGLPAVIADTISDEADVIKPLIKRLSLQEPFSAWAEALVTAHQVRAELTKDKALAIMEDSKFNVLSSCKKLMALYDECI